MILLRVLSVLSAYLLSACASDPTDPPAPAASTGAETPPPVTEAEVPIAPAPEVPSESPSADPGVPVASPVPAEVPADPQPSNPTQPVPPPLAAGPAPSAAADPTRSAAVRSPATPAKAASGAPAATGAQAATAAPAAAAAPATQGGPPAANPAAPTTGRVVVQIAKLDSDDGKIQAALFRSEAGFPDDPSKAAMRKLAKIHNKRVELAFDRVPAGEFAVLVHHDENGDSKMQTGLFGMPAEGYAISRDAPASFGPPSYEDARLTLKPGEVKVITVKMRY